MISHGSLTGDPLTAMFDTAAAGIGTFGMYRNNMDHASILKIREYMARGLPFIYAHDDPDLTEDMPWCIRFPNDDSPVDMQRVADFVDKVREHTGLSGEMRAYAAGHMSWEAQFTKLFGVLSAAGVRQR